MISPCIRACTIGGVDLRSLHGASSLSTLTACLLLGRFSSLILVGQMLGFWLSLVFFREIFGRWLLGLKRGFFPLIYRLPFPFRVRTHSHHHAYAHSLTCSNIDFFPQSARSWRLFVCSIFSLVWSRVVAHLQAFLGYISFQDQVDPIGLDAMFFGSGRLIPEK